MLGNTLEYLRNDVCSDKPSEANNDIATAKTEVESMVSVIIQQDMSSIPLMTSPIIDLTSRPKSPKVHRQLKATTTETTTTTTTLLPPPYQQQQSTAEAMMMKRIGELEHIMANLIQENKGLEQRLDSHGARLYTLEQLDIPHQVSKAVNEVVTDAVVVCSSLRSLEPKCTIESRAKRSSKIISLGHYSNILASSHTVKSKTDIKSPTHYPCGIPTVAAAGQRDVNSQLHAHTSNSFSRTR
nr:hypothetical protein [Tanacetum cinerariifolium]